MIRVVLADDHPFVRTGIRNILHKTADIIVVGEAGDGHQALRLVEQLEPDALVLDMEMPGMRGYEVAKRLSSEGKSIPILALSAHEDRQYILGMLTYGAFGYLTKDEVPEMLVRAVRGVANGERGWISRRVAARLALWLQNENPGQLSLTGDEMNALRMMLAGKSQEEIGNALHMERTDVDQCLNDIFSSVRQSMHELF